MISNLSRRSTKRPKTERIRHLEGERGQIKKNPSEKRRKRNRPTRKEQKKKKEQRKKLQRAGWKEEKKEEKQKQTINKKEKRRKKGTVSKLHVQILLFLCQLIFGFVKKEFKLIIMVKALVLMTKAFLEG